MKNSVIFVANGFSRDNVRLQPWRYIYELAKHQSHNNQVIVITEGENQSTEEIWEEGFTVVQTNLLSIKKQKSLLRFLNSFNPDHIWWSTTTRSIAFFPLLKKLRCRKTAFITSPLYKWNELIRASLYGVPYEQSKALWSQRFIPRFLFRLFLNANIFQSVTVQSKNNKKILEANGVKKHKVHYLPVGIDEEDVKPVDVNVLKEVQDKLSIKTDEIIFLYLGALRPIRGFDALIKAFPEVIRKNANARLVVLARGASEEKCDSLKSQLNEIGIANNVSIEGGWLTREQVWSYIELSNIVVLPFVLVPSDIPIAVLEALARGKPVVVSEVDGLPELARDRGVITDPLNTNKFSEDLSSLANDKAIIEKYTESAESFIKTYPRWSDVGLLMDKIDCDTDK